MILASTMAKDGCIMLMHQVNELLKVSTPYRLDEINERGYRNFKSQASFLA